MGLLLTTIISVLLVGVAFAKILQAKQLVDELKDKDSDYVTRAEIKTNALGLLVFAIAMFALLIAQMVGWSKYLLPSSASVHGEEIDTLLDVTNILILSVFFITQSLLFWFGYKYYFRKGRKAYWFPHNNSLEMAWTIVPAAVLILLITYGMSTWGKIMNPEDEPDVHIEFVSEQFKWTARYAGLDKKLGEASFSLYGKNALGIATELNFKNAIDTMPVCKIFYSSHNIVITIIDDQIGTRIICDGCFFISAYSCNDSSTRPFSKLDSIVSNSTCTAGNQNSLTLNRAVTEHSIKGG